MKKYFSAQFALECIIEDGAVAPDFCLRDRNGNIAARGFIQEIVGFFDSSFKEFLKQKETVANKN